MHVWVWRAHAPSGCLCWVEVWRVCVCAVRGLGRCAWRSPRRPDSPPVPLQFPERIVFFLSEEERPAHREMGPKVGKVMKEISKCNEFKHSSVSLTEKKSICLQTFFSLLHKFKMKVDWPKARMSSLCTAQVTVFIREAEVRPANSMLYRNTT